MKRAVCHNCSEEMTPERKRDAHGAWLECPKCHAFIEPPKKPAQMSLDIQAPSTRHYRHD